MVVIGWLLSDWQTNKIQGEGSEPVMDKFFDSGDGGEVVDDSSPRFMPWKPDKPLGYENLHASFLRLTFL